jgi:ubiquinone/menaquinone biosynthesis C-methylase UbiE
MEGAEFRPMISSSKSPWISAVCRKGENKPFENLLSVKHYLDTPVHTPTDDLEIGTDLSAFVAKDDYPIPSYSDRERYHKDYHYDWWVSGLRDYIRVKRMMGRYGMSLNPGDNMFELGCASGRVLRHFACQEEGLNVWGADINLRHVEWVRKFLPKKIRIFQNTILPQLALEDKSQKLVCAFSVFTHIDDFELAWLAEIRRVLVPGGLAYLTIHSEHTWQTMTPEWPLWKHLMEMKEHISDYKVSEDLFKNPMPAPKTVFWWSTAQVYNSSVFHSDDYIHDAWGRFLSVKEIVPSGFFDQAAVVLLKE